MEAIKSIYIYGKSGHGSVIEDIALANGYKNIIYIDDDLTKKDVLRYNKKLEKNTPFALGMGDNLMRKKIAYKLMNDGFYLTTLIHPSAIVSKSANIKNGSVVMPLCVINANAQIGVGVIVNSGSIIEHDCRLDNFVHVSPNASLAGGISVGELTHIGLNSSIKECIKIGKNSIIGAGSIVINNIEDNVVCVGNPAKTIRKNIK